jgi:hypothetical protein
MPKLLLKLMPKLLLKEKLNLKEKLYVVDGSTYSVVADLRYHH